MERKVLYESEHVNIYRCVTAESRRKREAFDLRYVSLSLSSVA